MTEAMSVWIQFLICASFIVFAGMKLVRYGDIIAEKIGWSGTWVGILLLATVTSLPELSTGLSAVLLVDAPNIAVGNVLGSCMFNLFILVIIDLLYRQELLYRRISQGHILSAAFGIVLLSLIGLGLLLSDKTQALSFGTVDVFVWASALLYLLAMRTIFVYESETVEGFIENVSARYLHLTLRQAYTGYALAASVVIGAGIWLPFIAADLAQIMGWNDTFIGSLFVAIVTSLPELAVTLSALHLGAIDMAVANLLGSNLFNMLVLAINDLFYFPGPILSRVSPIHTVTAFSAILMTGMVITGIVYRPISRPLRTVSWISIGMAVVFFLTSYALYRYGN